MSIREEARQEAERRWPSPNTGLYEGLIIGFEKGAVWASEQPDREPSDAEVEAAAESILYENQPNSTRHAVDWPVSTTDAVEIARAALLAAQEVRHEYP